MCRRLGGDPGAAVRFRPEILLFPQESCRYAALTPTPWRCRMAKDTGVPRFHPSVSVICVHRTPFRGGIRVRMCEPELRITAIITVKITVKFTVKHGTESGHWRETEVMSLQRQRDGRCATAAPRRWSLLYRGLYRGVYRELNRGLAAMLAGASLLGLLAIAGCQGGTTRSDLGMQSQRYRATPAQHARSQVQWLRSKGDQLTPQQLHLLQQIPWNASSDVEEARRRMLERGGEEGDREPEFVRQRILGRPRVMDAAREAAQQEEDDSQ